MDLLSNIVLSNGYLNESLIIKRERLYKGNNGRYVERFFVSPSQSFIYKPVTNDGQSGKEAWVYEHVLPAIPQIYPKLIAKSSSSDPSLSWLVFEDLGPIKHIFNQEVAADVAKHMAHWHNFPAETLADFPLAGPKPRLKEIAEAVVARREEVLQLLSKLGIPEKLIEKIYRLLKQKPFSACLVPSHGDLHLGNYGLSKCGLVVLDWEHAHLNTPFWDLYHLIDISHPLFPKTVTKQLRNSVLDTYLAHSGRAGENFKREYYLFSSVFSIWMLLLIISDLNRKTEKWPKETLKKQLRETVSSLTQCAEELE